MAISDEKGFLVPEWYVKEDVDAVAMNLASLFWGFALACAVFTAAEAFIQSQRAWRRHKTITVYIGMLWGEWAANMCMGAMSWSYQMGYLPPSFQFYFGIAFVWVFQIHFLLQIIINRIALLMPVQDQAKKLKIYVFVICAFINLTVFIIWIPARLQINETWIRVNEIWDPIEKIIFCIVDAGLNLYFVYLVRTKLIGNGLTKYIPLYKINLVMVAVSLSLDCALIGLMFSPDSLMYLQFHPVVYLSKLYIEMGMADLIIKVVRASNPQHYDYHLSSSTGKDGKSKGTAGGRFTTQLGTGHNHKMRGLTSVNCEGGAKDEVELVDNKRSEAGAGIHKTIETTVVYEDQGNDAAETESRSSSTRELRRHYGVSDGSPPEPSSALDGKQ